MKVIVNICVHKAPKRVESLKRTVDAVIGQCDQINIQWNGFSGEEIPQWAFRTPIINSYGTDYSDLGKFAFLEFIKEPCYYITLDSDMLPPPDFIKQIKQDIEKYKCIVTYHGRILNRRNRTTFYEGHHTLKWNNDVKQDQEVDVPGTGLMGFRTDYFWPLNLHKTGHEKMADLVFGYYAKLHNKKIVCAKHSRSWIKSLNLKGIWHEFNEGKRKKPETLQVQMMNEIMDL